MAIDEQQVEAAVGKVFGELGVAITGPLIALGDRLGLWAAMAGAGPVTRFPIDTLDAHLCVVRDDGLTVFDACRGRAVHEEFTKSDTFPGAIAAAGLPTPRIEGLGDAHLAHLSREVRA